jgi:hypothetical protein
MKTKVLKSIKNAVLFIVIMIITASCSKGKESPDYAGKWIYEKENSRSVLMLGSNTFESQSYALLQDNSYYLYAAIFADLEVNSDTFDIYYTKMQIDDSYEKNHVPSGELTTYTKEMYSNVEGIDSLWHLQYRYKVNGDKLTLCHDTMSWIYNRIQ